jgi:hypothetical protein
VIGGLVEHEEVGTGEQSATERHATPLTAREGVYNPVRVRRVQIRDKHFDPAFEIPSVEVLNPVEQLHAARTLRRHTLVVRDEIENMARTDEDVFVHRGVIIESEHLGHETRHQLPPAGESPGIRFEYSRCNLQERGFACAIASNKSNALLLVNAQRGVVENGLGSVPDDEMAGIGDNDWSEVGHGEFRIADFELRIVRWRGRSLCARKR